MAPEAEAERPQEGDNNVAASVPVSPRRAGVDKHALACWKNKDTRVAMAHVQEGGFQRVGRAAPIWAQQHKRGENEYTGCGRCSS